MLKRACIFGSAPVSDYALLKEYTKDALIICADGGLRHAKAMGLSIDVIIGDNDSNNLDFPEGTEVHKYPSRKDFTDTHLCVDYAIDHGCREIILIGGTGGRLDHEFSHFCLMAYALEKGATLKMVDENNEAWMTDKGFNLKSDKFKYVSFFPYGGNVYEFSVSGFKYEAENIELSTALVQASSNEFLENTVGSVSFKSGILLVICSDKK